ncbi:hypothetical protein DPEC_G00082770 [Dallia pectoralis]|uniref:Uncharacterized protein n=1 Tax=Dallia pectoralis TaxID=75939 RepID=A0ACC2GYQ7_DALPE|nr:hypothetical protein DPEC_G00082770 [Dallia pectoralis]
MNLKLQSDSLLLSRKKETITSSRDSDKNKETLAEPTENQGNLTMELMGGACSDMPSQQVSSYCSLDTNNPHSSWEMLLGRSYKWTNCGSCIPPRPTTSV